MNLKQGAVLKCTVLLNGTYFEDAVVFITESNDKGAIGFIINRKSERNLNELVEFNYCFPFPLFEGGPVEQDNIYFLHREPSLISGGVMIKNTIYLGGNFKEAVCLINKKVMNENLKLFLGYCGWDAGQLEAEIEEGSWTLMDEDIDVF